MNKTCRNTFSYPHSLLTPQKGQLLQNEVPILGGIQRDAEEPQSQILKYDTDQNDWLEVGKMNIPRYYHAATIMPRAKIEQYCIV